MRAFLVAILLVAATSAGLWAYGIRPDRLWSGQGETYLTIAIARGDVRSYVLESGNLESSNNATIKCQVEALLGMVGGTQTAANGAMGNNRGGGMGGNAAGGHSGSLTQAGGGQAGGGQAAAQAAAAKSGTARSVNTSAANKMMTGSGGATAGAAGAVKISGGGGAAGGGGGGAVMARPVIRSFSMQVAPHVPIRPKTVTTGATKNANQGMNMGMGRRWRRRQSGRQSRRPAAGHRREAGVHQDPHDPPGGDEGQGRRRGLHGSTPPPSTTNSRPS